MLDPISNPRCYARSLMALVACGVIRQCGQNMGTTLVHYLLVIHTLGYRYSYKTKAQVQTTSASFTLQSAICLRKVRPEDARTICQLCVCPKSMGMQLHVFLVSVAQSWVITGNLSPVRLPRAHAHYRRQGCFITFEYNYLCGFDRVSSHVLLLFALTHSAYWPFGSRR